MATELPYLNSYKNVGKLFDKIGAAAKPEAFTHRFLTDTLGLKSATTDRPLIPLLRTLGFIDSAGKPTADYNLLKNPAKRGAAIATAIRKAYKPLFAANENAHNLSGTELQRRHRSSCRDRWQHDEQDRWHLQRSREERRFLRGWRSRRTGGDEEGRQRQGGEEGFDHEVRASAGVPLQLSGASPFERHGRDIPEHLQCATESVSMRDEQLALFIALGQTADRVLRDLPETVPPMSLSISSSIDLATVIPEAVKHAATAAEGYKLFYVLENYLRELVVDVLSKEDAEHWWDKVPKDVQDDVAKLEETEEAKQWMALGSRDKSALMTYPQLLRVMDHCWKVGFEDLLRDKTLLHQSRAIGHLRNTLCHMTEISDEETERIRQTMRDWFRVVAP